MREDRRADPQPDGLPLDDPPPDELRASLDAIAAGAAELGLDTVAARAARVRALLDLIARRERSAVEGPQDPEEFLAGAADG